MRTFIIKALLLALWAFTASAQTQIIDVADRHITFDKLKSTVIEFVATSKPEILVEPDTKVPYTIQYQNGRGKIVFSSPFSEGNYTIKLSLAGTAQNTHCTLSVLPTQLDQRSTKSLANLKFGYGKRLMVRSSLPPEAELPLSQFFVEYKLGTEQPVESPYVQQFTGPYIPASAKKVRVAVVWKYAATGEKVVLFSKEVEPDQTSPDIIVGYGEVATGTYNPRDNSYLITLPSAFVDYEVPVDAPTKQ